MLSFMRRGIFGLLISILSVVIIIAQGAACSELVQTALESANANCGELGRNQVCYGYNNVQASFLSDVPDDFFSQVSDVSSVVDLASVQTLPMNTETGQWGVAVMAIQAKLPNTLPGDNIKFVLLGDVTVENAVAPENAFVPNEGIEIILAVESANLRSGAGLNFNVIAGVERGETVIADGLNDNGRWLRVVKDNRAAWLSRDLVLENPEIDSLPVLTDEVMMPMQAFYLRTSITGDECIEAPPNSLVVQGPENFQVQLTVNGANVSLGSTGVFQTIDVNGEPFLQLDVLDGTFEIDGTVVRAGQRTQMCLGNEDSRGLDGENNDLVVSCAPSAPRYVPNFGTQWCNTEALPSSILNYEIEVQCPGETPAPVATEETVNSEGVSETEAVDCKSFAILTGDIPATVFTLAWTPIAGADNYEIAVFDSGGYQVSSTMTGGSSLDMNGGASFPPSGYVDVRAFGGGNYLCFARKDFTRSVDPNEISRPAAGNVAFSCSHLTGIWSLEIIWDNLPTPIHVGFTGTNTSPISDYQNSSSSSGIYASNPSALPQGSVLLELTDGDGNYYSKTC